MSFEIPEPLFAYKSELIAGLTVFATGMLTYACYSILSVRKEDKKDSAPRLDEMNDSCPTISELPLKADNTIGDATWPPPEREVHVYSVREMFKANAGLIREICVSSQLSDEEASAYLLPAISNLAHIVHLVPASECDHHQGYGGLFTHSLEVALKAANIERSKVHERAKCPTDDHNNKRRWILCAILAGLGHDIGKVYADMSIVTNTKASWTHEVPLLDWLRKTQATSYYANFLPNREHNRHRKISHARLNQLIPAKTQEFLSLTGYGAMLFDAIADAIQDGTGPVGKSLEMADGQSTKEDMERQARISPNYKNISHPQATQILKVFRELINSGKWSSNEDNHSTVFNTRQGCFIVWSEKTAQDILQKATEMDFKAIPSGAVSMQQILERAGVLSPSPTLNATIWTVTPQVCMTESLSCICVANPNQIFDNPPPPVIESVVLDVQPDDKVFKIWRESGKPLEGDPHIAQSAQSEKQEKTTTGDANATSQSETQNEQRSNSKSRKGYKPPAKETLTTDNLSALIPNKNDGVSFLDKKHPETQKKAPLLTAEDLAPSFPDSKLEIGNEAAHNDADTSSASTSAGEHTKKETKRKTEPWGLDSVSEGNDAAELPSGNFNPDDKVSDAEAFSEVERSSGGGDYPEEPDFGEGSPDEDPFGDDFIARSISDSGSDADDYEDSVEEPSEDEIEASLADDEGSVSDEDDAPGEEPLDMAEESIAESKSEIRRREETGSPGYKTGEPAAERIPTSKLEIEIKDQGHVRSRHAANAAAASEEVPGTPGNGDANSLSEENVISNSEIGLIEIDSPETAVKELLKQMLNGKGNWITQRIEIDPTVRLPATSSLAFESAIKASSVPIDLVLLHLNRLSNHKVVPRVEVETTSHQIFLIKDR